ncbi:MAG: tRNA dihydrouridine synthase DusB [Lachnospiraceae bacterium]|nr:tRNA dihydrouridine synthase DusB [Lachnospiraceae bacterium]
MSGHIYTVLSPMAGVTDMSYRVICHEMGADLTVTEMISAKAVTYGNKATYALCRIDGSEHPVSLQIFGSEPETMAEAAKILRDKIPFDMMDINMGCPMPKIVNNGEGSALMRDPILVGRIVEAVSKAIDRPVTVKIRAGFDAEHINAAEVAYVAQESGAQTVTVHGRTREQYYEGKADLEVIAEVKRRLNIRVIGNGDVRSIADARRMTELTGCDGVAVGRAAQGNPWIFKELSEGREYIPSSKEKKEMMLRHLDMTVAEKGEYIGIREMRKHIGWYTSGMPGSAKLRVKINKAETLEEMKVLIFDFDRVIV